MLAAAQQNATSDVPMAASWGSSINMANMSTDNAMLMAENVMYTRTFLAKNKEVFNDDGSVNMAKVVGNFAVPEDLANVMKDASPQSSTSADSSSASSGSASSSSSAPSTSATKSAAGRTVAVSSSLAGVVALGAAFFAL